MKRILSAFFTLIIIFSLYSCQNKKTDCTEATGFLPVNGMNEVSTDVPTDPPIDPEIVSPLAEKNLMQVENYSWEREYPVEFVMIHFCSDVVSNRQYPYGMNAIRRTFEQNNVSINYIIARNGDIQCWIPEQRAAWHAGKGTWKDEEKYTNLMNKYSIGIELVAIGSKKDMSPYLSGSNYNSISKSLIGFTNEQYASLISLLNDICGRWNIPKDRDHIIGHEEYSSSRKTDPGELFNWDKVISGINS